MIYINLNSKKTDNKNFLKSLSQYILAHKIKKGFIHKLKKKPYFFT
ncbi:hypothetical protein HDEF_1268 [Candidatus Hamiltonella defensa 5AT (Acyrthosiphon pisum)]|uniref:Uncharacterized protein n=1 Tax=Hamiltonella defensa subsp. Acyrthosiphon pisum (strain 5AT) TaxID=572265 RepID=C4K5S8_HAMD5|nr:hypothetical protein HDEF_1268 [Candidatus Hamiltonella defensa 5AT (Acyrthosiphon pisum)]